MIYSPQDSRGTILIVDDQPEELKVLSQILEDNGHSVRGSTVPMLAIESAIANPPDLILMDILMPEMNGFEATRQLKNNEVTRDIPVVFVSAKDTEIDKVQAFEVGGVDYITKPFLLQEVETRVESRLKLLAVNRSIREQSESLERLLREQLILQKQQDEFVQMLVHDMRSPLSAINLTLDMLNDVESLSAWRKDNADMAAAIPNGLTACQSLIRLVDEMLNVKKIRKKGLPIQSRLLPVEDLLQAARLMLPDTSNVDFRTCDGEIWCDKTVMSRVLVNLITNAAQHGGGSTRVVVTVRVDESHAVLQVVDNGPGVSAEMQDRIFERFFSGQHALAEPRRTGLGLAFCRLAVEAHDGVITVESTVGQGTTFTIRLPSHGMPGTGESVR